MATTPHSSPPHATDPTPGPGRRPNGGSIGTLLRDLSREVATLVRKEGALARAELGEKLGQARAGATELGSGAMITFAGFLVLLAAAVFGLENWVGSMWLSALIVGGIALLVGLVLLARARSNLRVENLAPEHTAASLRRDADLAYEAGAHARAGARDASDSDPARVRGESPPREASPRHETTTPTRREREH